MFKLQKKKFYMRLDGFIIFNKVNYIILVFKISFIGNKIDYYDGS